MSSSSAVFRQYSKMAAACRRVISLMVPRILLTNRSIALTAPAFSASIKHHGYFTHQRSRFCSSVPKPKQETVAITFVMPDGEKVQTKAKVGDNLLDVVIENSVDIDGFGACEGTLACSTCHLIFKQSNFDQLPNPPTDEELDMLDLAFDLHDTSRLGCQVIVTKEMDGWEIRVPAGVSDAREPS